MGEGCLIKIGIDLCQDFLGRLDPYLEGFFVAGFFVCFWLNKN